MERQDWFAYGNGYINIDNDFLYVSRTGVWSEVRSLEEKSANTTFGDNINRVRIMLFMVPAIALLSFVAYLSISSLLNASNLKWDLNSLLQYIGAPILCVFGVIYIYKYFKKDLGVSYKIPLSKLESIDFKGKDAVCLTFLDSKDKSQQLHLNKVESKGIDILSKMD